MDKESRTAFCLRAIRVLSEARSAHEGTDIDTSRWESDDARQLARNGKEGVRYDAAGRIDLNLCYVPDSTFYLRRNDGMDPEDFVSFQELVAVEFGAALLPFTNVSP